MRLRPIRAREAGDGKWDRLYGDAHARLMARIEEHGIPMPPWAPAQDICVVYRIPNDYQSPNGLILPEAHAENHDSPYSLGVLLMAGPEASDVLESHGVLPGDYVKFARFAGEEEEAARIHEAIAKRATGPAHASALANAIRNEAIGKKKLLELQVPFIHGSVDLLERLYGPTPTMEMVRHVLPSGKVTHLILPV